MGAQRPTWRRLPQAAVLLAAWAGATACAQNVTLFGLMDTAVEQVNQVGADRAPLRRMPSLTGTLPSRIGFRGSEDLGGGQRAVFTLEQGFAPDVGVQTQGGRAYGRQAFVGFSGDWGSLTFGRQYTMLYWSLLDADVLGPNLYGTGSLDAYIPNARVDNAFVYRGSLGGWSLGASFSLGRDAVNAGSAAGTNCAGELADSRACREVSLLLKFDTAAWGAAAAVDRINGGPGAFAGLGNSALTDTRVSVNGYAKWKAHKFTLGVVQRENGASAITPRSDLWYAGWALEVAPAWVIDGEILRLKFKGSADQATLGALRATYSLSRRTAVYAMAGRMANGGSLALSVSAGAGGSNPLPGTAQTGAAAGVRVAF
jgi:predicted porin